MYTNHAIGYDNKYSCLLRTSTEIMATLQNKSAIYATAGDVLRDNDNYIVLLFLNKTTATIKP